MRDTNTVRGRSIMELGSVRESALISTGPVHGSAFLPNARNRLRSARAHWHRVLIDASVTIRPLILIPAQRVSQIRAVTDVFAKTSLSACVVKSGHATRGACPSWGGGRHFCRARETVAGQPIAEPAAATRMARVVTPVTRLGRTCDSENAHRYWVCHTCHACHTCHGSFGGRQP
jgi:hypothetical protein